MNGQTKNIIAALCRVALGLTFVFSGFVKTIDPWGTAFKIGEYLSVYGAVWVPDWLRISLAVAFCAAELALGLLLVFRVVPRMISLAAFWVMSVFLVVTLLSATVLPVEDCGCFGDALHLSAWGSFGKNVVLWALAVVVWLSTRRLGWLAFPKRHWIFAAVFAGLSGGLGLWCYTHLPLVDFLPYKEGVNLREAVLGLRDEARDDRMIYRDLTDGSTREFAVSDTTWWDSSRWEFVEMAPSSGDAPDGDVSLREFAVFNAAGDATREILEHPGRVYMLCAVRLEQVGERCGERFAEVVERAAAERDARVILITSSPISDGETATFGAAESDDAAPVEVYNVDATTMMTMLRARTGMVVLEDGMIIDKKSCRDI
ncbi:MAG: DoxX protein [Alistipes sp.]|nr:DoxX protein [Alistipes sp.]